MSLFENFVELGYGVYDYRLDYGGVTTCLMVV